eukprot:TRINITY_DN7668_c0_g1_i1.p1 TRINITY_DN7668_c0_g1~~TRINITY_DN7668_c0_g1_i1.p1  ORF type:complete len:168 (-),score=42.91 TRINITY_DN7668_c0_g1_i1:47-550(-)
MIISSIFLTTLLSLTSLCKAEKVDTCIMCTSDSGSNKACEKDVVPDSQPNGACSAEFGNDYCYVLVTKQKQPVEAWQWNRGCCTPKAGSSICPLSEPSHVSNEVYEMWRARCDTNDCNLMDPRTSSGGMDGFEGSLVVHGKRNGAAVTHGNMLLLVALGIISYMYSN